MKIKITQEEYDKIAGEFSERQAGKTRSMSEAVNNLSRHMSKYKIIKKIIIVILILVAGMTAHAGNYDQALIDLWNRRPDLQKAFPGGATNNARLEKWAAQTGWKENATLFNFYPDKKIIENIITDQIGARIAVLENQVNDLTIKNADLNWRLTQTKAAMAGKWQRYCHYPVTMGNDIKMMQPAGICNYETIYLFQQ
jgi:hypothetical protein